MDNQNQKKEFTFPKKEELIEQIKDLDDQIQHVSLNLIKCDFNATQKDVQKTFPQYKFIKIKNYNPGSYEVILDMKIDAINFIRNCYDRKILNRRFFIKLGRQNKQVIEDWACVGQVPKKFNKNYNKNNNYKKNNQNKKKIEQGSQKKGQLKPQGQKLDKKPKRQYKKDKQEKKTQKKQQQNQQNKEKKQKNTQISEKQKPKQQQQNTKEQKDDNDDGWIVIGKNSKKNK